MRLIDADALLKKKDIITIWHDGNRASVVGIVYEDDIEEAPTVDAVPVAHGEWSNRRTWTHDGEWYCTACDKEITIYMGEKRGNDRYKYCPNCGAKMDGEKKEDG